MAEFGDLLRSAAKHARKAREYAKESNELAVVAMVEAARCHRIAAGINEAVAEAVKPFDPVEAARTHLELARLNADLAESWAKDAENYCEKAKAISGSLLCKGLGGVLQTSSS